MARWRTCGYLCRHQAELLAEQCFGHFVIDVVDGSRTREISRDLLHFRIGFLLFGSGGGNVWFRDIREFG